MLGGSRDNGLLPRWRMKCFCLKSGGRIQPSVYPANWRDSVSAGRGEHPHGLGTPRAPFRGRETCAFAGAARSWSWQRVCCLDRAFTVLGINLGHGLFIDPLPVPAHTFQHLSSLPAKTWCVMCPRAACDSCGPPPAKFRSPSSSSALKCVAAAALGEGKAKQHQLLT